MTMWVDKYRPKKFSDLLGEDVRCRHPLQYHADADFSESIGR